MTQRWLPSPDPCSVLRLAMIGLMPRARSACRCRLRVVAAVGEERVRPTAWASASPAQRRDRLDEREQLDDVGLIGAGEQAGERDAVGVDDQVVLAPGLAPVDGARPGLVAPKSARSEAESQTVRERSSSTRRGDITDLHPLFLRIFPD